MQHQQPDLVDRQGAVVVDDQVRELARLAIADRQVERHRLGGQAEQVLGLLGRELQLSRELADRRIASERLEHRALHPQGSIHRLDHVDRHPDRARLVGQAARDRLPDPPGGVRRELEPALVVELLHRPDQADVAFLHEVEQ